MTPTAPLGRRLVVTALLLLVAAPAAAQGTDVERRAAAMQQVVLDQLAAFRRGDWGTAYGFASETIRAQFSPEAFRQMVTRGYASIAASTSASVLRTEADDPQKGYVEVRVYGQNGENVDALYELVDEQGAWKINGVVARPAERGDLARADAHRPASSHPWPSAMGTRVGEPQRMRHTPTRGQRPRVPAASSLRPSPTYS